MKTGYFIRAGLGCLAALAASGFSLSEAGQFSQQSTGTVSTFDRTLEVLRESVASLVQENKSLNEQNLGMRARINAVGEEIRSLEAESARIQVKKSAEIERARRRTGGVEAIKDQVGRMDGALKQVRSDIAAQQAALSALEDQERTLGQKSDALNAAINISGSGSAAWGQEFAALQAERDSLQKDFYDVANRVQQAKKQWQDIHTAVTAGPEQAEALKSENQMLVASISRIDGDMARVGAQLAAAQAGLDKLLAEDLTDVRAARLESEVKDMADRNRRLEAEIVVLENGRDEKLARLEKERQVAREQYAARKEDLLVRNMQLRVDLDDLCKQMVVLDKKKAALEADVYPAP